MSFIYCVAARATGVVEIVKVYIVMGKLNRKYLTAKLLAAALMSSLL